ncbi:MAG TPA: hypothetical protein VGO80_18380 [Solirubrobacteraceae bacterium]|jgi:hypothetical protein|nr:hypothetical protein [Solirubrobacteraceae bacterium]
MDQADDLLQRALLDAEACASVALKVSDLPLSEALTVIFHGRRDLGTLQTYVTHGGRAAGSAVGASELLRVPCDLDLAHAMSRDEAEELYAEQARALRDAIVAADNVLAIWAGPLAAATGGDVQIERSIELGVRLPAHRLMPVALTAPERRMLVAAVCGARTLAEGRPPMGIVCAQQDLTHVYQLSDDPEHCLEDFGERAAEHARRTAQRLYHQEASVQRFLELNGDDFQPTA